MTSPRLRMTTPAQLLLCAATLLVLGGCSSQDTDTDTASDTAAAPNSPTTSSPDPASAPPLLIPYDGDGSHPAEVRTPADADTLAGAPDSFKEFIGRTAERVTDGATCEDGYVGVTVRALRTDGYADGSVNDCDGYLALWAIVDGDWTEIDATKDLWDCAALTEHRVPSDIAGDTCYDRDAQAQRSYQQA